MNSLNKTDEQTATILLKKLVLALESTWWSSWQTTANFAKEQEAAREFIESLSTTSTNK